METATKTTKGLGKICSNCKGKGTWPCIAKMYTDKGWQDQPPVYMPCTVCNEKGYLTPEDVERNRIKKEESDKFWCKCQDGGRDSYYVPDGMNDGCSKHHYRCCKCHKVTQVG